jgi:CDP-diacylglycerol--glycerol-3-phosphate 3-phosphatidyltransferase
VGVSLIVAREMAVSVLRMIAAGKGLVLAAEKVGKVKTFLTDFAILFLLISADFVIMYYLGVVLFIISVILTVYSGIFYLVKNREVFK